MVQTNEDFVTTTRLSAQLFSFWNGKFSTFSYDIKTQQRESFDGFDR